MSDQAKVQRLHSNLCQKFQSKGPQIWKRWKWLDQEQRTKYVMAASPDGKVLQHPEDQSLKAASACVPEWNLQDLTSPGSEEHLMELLQYRGETDLIDQYWSAMYEHLGDGLGDREFIMKAMETKDLRYDVDDRETKPGGYICFTDNEMYAQYLPPSSAMMMAGLQMFMAMGNVVPRDTGKLVLTRQIYFFERLNNIVDDILSGKPRKRGGPAAGDLALRPKPQNPPPELELIPVALDRKMSLEVHLAVLSSDPTLLSRDVESWFSSRPELVADERGRSLPKDTDRHINGAVLDTVRNAVKSAATWAYITKLLERAESKDTDSVYRAILLQEISNVCHHEFAQAQSSLRRHVSKESKWFKRVSNTYDAVGNARITSKGKTDNLMDSDPQLYNILRLCHQDTSATQAVVWLKRLSDLHKARPAEWEKLSEAEAGALADVATIVGYFQDMSRKISLPPLSRRKCQLFVSRSQQLEIEMNELKKDLDLGEYAVPISKLLEPGMAEGALNALDQFVVEKAGTKLGFLYQDLIDDCFSYLQRQYDENKTKPGSEWTPVPMLAREQREKLIEQRKEKHGARSSPLSDYEIAPRPKDSAATEDTVSSAGMEAFKVSQTTTKVFETLFGEAGSCDPVSWKEFKDAMVELKFSVVSKDHSVFTFVPPSSMGPAKKPFTVYRPYKDQIGGPTSLILAQRLTKTYSQ